MLVAQSCLALCDPLDCSPSGSSVQGILQARILQWVTIPFFRGSSWPRGQTRVSCVAGRFWATREAKPGGSVDSSSLALHVQIVATDLVLLSVSRNPAFPTAAVPVSWSPPAFHLILYTCSSARSLPSRWPSHPHLQDEIRSEKAGAEFSVTRSQIHFSSLCLPHRRKVISSLYL